MVEVVRPPVSGPWDYALLSGIGSSVKRIPSLLPDNEDELPPLLITTGEDEAQGVCLFQCILIVSIHLQPRKQSFHDLLGQTCNILVKNCVPDISYSSLYKHFFEKFTVLYKVKRL